MAKKKIYSDFTPLGIKPLKDADDHELFDIDTNESITTLQNKMKTLYVYDALLALTDPDHKDSNKGATLADITDYVTAKYHTSIDRKSFYPIIHALQASGIDISQEKGKYAKYRIESRLFSIDELKLIAGAISSCRILDKAQSNSMLLKLKKLASERNGLEHLDFKPLDTANRPSKDDSQKIFQTINTINKAIYQRRPIKFQYQYYSTSVSNDNKRGTTLKLTKGGQTDRFASPYELVWEDGKYYLICHEPSHDKERTVNGKPELFKGLTHLRVDRMTNISILEEKKKKGKGKNKINDITEENSPYEYIPVNEIVNGFKIKDYLRSVFSMYGNDEETFVTISFPKNGGIVGAIIDKFGSDVKMIPDKDGSYYVKVPVRVSAPFFAWIMQFGGSVQIKAPQNVRDQFITHMNNTLSAHTNASATQSVGKK